MIGFLVGLLVSWDDPSVAGETALALMIGTEPPAWTDSKFDEAIGVGAALVGMLATAAESLSEDSTSF